MTLPPVLYWSAALAARHEDGPDGLLAGVVDATGSIFYRHDGDGIRVVGELPADAVRLVCDPTAPSVAATEIQESA